MMTAAQSLARIADLLERAMQPGMDPRDVRSLITQAHTHAVLRAVHTRRAEARAVFAAFPELEHGSVQ